VRGSPPMAYAVSPVSRGTSRPSGAGLDGIRRQSARCRGTSRRARSSG
jgi:hypothetical protein